MFCVVIPFNGNLISQDENEVVDFSTPDAVVDKLYDLVTFEPGADPDWETVKTLFISDAVIVLRASMTAMTTHSKEEFVELFISDIKKHKLDESGFSEKILNRKTTIVGDVAYSVLLYEISIPNSGMPPQKGIDCFHLMKSGGKWKIVSIINEIPRPGVPIPDELKKG
jgi:hypothetical protein